MVISELASMAPTSGGQYHWCAMLAPPKYMKILSYLTGTSQPAVSAIIANFPGWVTVIGWQAAFASSAFLAGTEIQGAVTLGHANYSAQPWQGTLIMWAAVLFALGINIAGGKLLPRFETAVLVVHLVGFFGILIPITYMADHNSTHDVFLNFVNGGFPTQGLSWFVGMTGCVFAFAGGDAAVHVCFHCSSV